MNFAKFSVLFSVLILFDLLAVLTLLTTFSFWKLPLVSLTVYSADFLSKLAPLLNLPCDFSLMMAFRGALSNADPLLLPCHPVLTSYNQILAVCEC